MYVRSAANVQQKKLSQMSRNESASRSALPTADVDTASVSDNSTLAEALLKDDAVDYLTARRQAKEFANALDSIDAQLRALQTAELPQAPSKTELAQLLHSCSRYGCSAHSEAYRHASPSLQACSGRLSFLLSPCEQLQ